MKKHVLIFTLVFLIILPSLIYPIQPGPQDLTYLCEDIPPSNYMDKGVLKGVSVEILRAIWEQMGCKPQPIEVVPWARGYEQALNGKTTVLFSMSRTKDRDKLFKWAGPIFTVKTVLFGTKKSKIHLKSLSDAKKYRIGTIKDDVAESILVKNGFSAGNIESVPGLRRNFEKLKLGRIDLIANSLDTCNEYIKENLLNPGDYTQVFIMEENTNYFAFSMDVPDTLVKRFQSALEKTAAERSAILKKYGVGL